MDVSRTERAANLMSAATDHQGYRDYAGAVARLQLALRYGNAEQRQAIGARLAAMPVRKFGGQA